MVDPSKKSQFEVAVLKNCVSLQHVTRSNEVLCGVAAREGGCKSSYRFL